MAWFILKNHCTFSQEQGGGYLEIYCSDEKLSEQSRLKNIQEKYCCVDRQITYCHISQFGMMSLLSDWITQKQNNTSNICNQLKMICASVEGSPAKTSQLQENKQDWMVNVQDFGLKCKELLAKYDQEKSLWKTHQCSLFEGLIESQEVFPKSGMTVDGQLWELMMSKHLTKEKEYGLSDIENKNGGCRLKYPTPTAHDGKGRCTHNSLIRKDGKPRMDQLCNFVVFGDFNQVRDFRLYSPDSKAKTVKTSCQLNPDWTEWLMGWPIGWTSLKPLSKEEFIKWFEKVLSNKWWDDDPADKGDLSRVTEYRINRSKRLKALGNGQVPLCVYTATYNLSNIKEC